MANNKKTNILKSILAKVELHDTGKRESSLKCCEAPSSENRVYYPNLWGLNSEQCPDLKGLEAGDQVDLVVKGTVRSHTINDNEKDGKKETWDIDITKMGVLE